MTYLEFPRLSPYRTLITIAMIIMPLSAIGYDLEQATANLASDLSECAAYYILISQGHESLKNDPELNRAGEIAFNTAVELSNVKVTQARMELAGKDMLEEIDNNYSNSAILINKYGEFCKQLLENPDERIEYWLKK